MQLKMQNSEEVEFCRKASRNETILVLVGEKVKESLPKEDGMKGHKKKGGGGNHFLQSVWRDAEGFFQ